MNNSITIIENFLSDEYFNHYLNISNENDGWGTRSSLDVWMGRVVYQSVINNFSYLSKVEKTIKTQYNINTDIYPDYLGLVKWECGDLQHPHADGELENELQHPYYWRDFGCVLYLNDNYEGGEIYFPNQNVQLKPKPNTLVFFPGTLEYLHGVYPITNGIRYTLTSFWTYNKKFNMTGYDNSTN